MSTTMTYFYPDVDDEIMLTLVLSENKDLRFWESVEDYILSYPESYLKRKRRHTLLDLGCGDGRLAIRFSKYFDKVIALEPDSSRMQYAKYNINSKKISNVEYIQAPFLSAELPNEEFDVVICSHIIQHMHTDMIAQIVQGNSNVLKKGGLLILLTNYSGQDEDFFVKSFLNKGKVCKENISEEFFNRLTVNNQNILPIHFFSKKSLQEKMSQFSIIRMDIFNDQYPNSLFDTILFFGEKKPF